jgi:type I restriction enzyme M protein
MPLDHLLIDEAEHRGYLTFDSSRTRITYNCGRKYTDDYTDPEESVRAAVYSWLILDKGYPANRIEVEYPIPRRSPGYRPT